MNGRKRVGLLLACILFMIVLWPEVALANSVEPPGFVILVSGAPEDLTIVMTDGAEKIREPIVLQSKRKNWETYYRFYYSMVPGEIDLQQVVLHITTGGATGLATAVIDRCSSCLDTGD